MIQRLQAARRWSLGLFIGSTVISQTLMDFLSFVFVLLSLFIWWQSSRIETRPLHSNIPSRFPLWLRVWISFFCAVVLVSMLLNWSLIPDAAWVARRLLDLKWILFLFLFFDTLQTFSWSEKKLSRWSWFICFIGIVGIGVSFLGFDPWKGPDFRVMPIGNHWIRTGGFLSNPMSFAHLLGLFLCLLGPFFWARKSFRPSTQTALWSALFFGGLAFLLTFTRGAWLALIIATLSCAFLRSWRRGFSIVGALSGILIVFSLAWPSFRERLLLSFNWGNDYDSERILIWKTSWQIFRDHPWWGVSPFGSSLLFPSYYSQLGVPEGTPVDHSHNQYLEALVSLGIPGLLLWTILLGIFAGMFWKLLMKTSRAYPADRSWAEGLWMAHVFFLIGGLTESNFLHSKVRTLMALVWALGLVYFYRLNAGHSYKEGSQ